MNEVEAREILSSEIGMDNSIRRGHPQVVFNPGSLRVKLNGYFTSSYLKAIVWWMENKGKSDLPSPPEGE